MNQDNYESVSEADLQKIKKLIDEAYPSPSRSIAASVTEQIKKEKIIPDSVRAGRLAIMRWGALAACVVIAVSVVLLVPGILNSGAKTADYAAASGSVEKNTAYTECEEEMPEYAEDEEAFYAAEDAGGVMNSGEPEMFEAPAEPAPEPPYRDVPEEMPVMKSASAAVEEEAEAAIDYAVNTYDTAYDEYVPVSDCVHSKVWRNCYHDIPGSLRSYVGENEFNLWACSQSGCGANLFDFALYFGLTKDEIMSVGDMYYFVDVPEDLEFTEENREAVEAYYAAGGDYAKMEERYNDYSAKCAVISKYGVTAYISEFGSSPLAAHTLDEIVNGIG